MKEPHENTGGFHNLQRLGFCERTWNERFSRSGFSERTLAVRRFSNLSNVGFLSKNLMHAFMGVGAEGGPDLQRKLSAGLEVGACMNLLKIAGSEVRVRVSQNENRESLYVMAVKTVVLTGFKNRPTLVYT